MPSELGPFFRAEMMPGSDTEWPSQQEMGFVARILNGCTLTRLAMNYSMAGEEVGSGSGDDESGDGSGDGSGVWSSSGPPESLPYCGLPWTVGQRVVKRMDTDGVREPACALPTAPLLLLLCSAFL